MIRWIRTGRLSIKNSLSDRMRSEGWTVLEDEDAPSSRRTLLEDEDATCPPRCSMHTYPESPPGNPSAEATSDVEVAGKVLRCTPNSKERVLYCQPTGPNPLHHRDDFSRPALRHGSLNSLVEWIRTSRLSIKNSHSLSLCNRFALVAFAIQVLLLSVQRLALDLAYRYVEFIPEERSRIDPVLNPKP